jgi:hypothetical protein
MFLSYRLYIVIKYNKIATYIVHALTIGAA